MHAYNERQLLTGMRIATQCSASAITGIIYLMSRDKDATWRRTTRWWSKWARCRSGGRHLKPFSHASNLLPVPACVCVCVFALPQWSNKMRCDYRSLFLLLLRHKDWRESGDFLLSPAMHTKEDGEKRSKAIPMSWMAGIRGGEKGCTTITIIIMMSMRERRERRHEFCCRSGWEVLSMSFSFLFLPTKAITASRWSEWEGKIVNDNCFPSKCLFCLSLLSSSVQMPPYQSWANVKCVPR